MRLSVWPGGDRCPDWLSAATSHQPSAKKEQQAISEEEAISIQPSAKKKQSALSYQLKENAPA